MKPSRIALLSVVGVVVGAILLAAVAARITLLGGGFARLETGAGAGDTSTVRRELSGFDEIEIEGAWSIDVTRGDDWQVDLSSPDNERDSMDASVRGDRLVLAVKEPGSFFGGSGNEFSAEVVMPVLVELNAAGSSQVTLSGFEGEHLSIEVAGATRISGENGRYDELDLSIAGAGDVDLVGFAFIDADIHLAGASSVTLTMDGGELTGEVAGASAIRYFGTVSREDVDVAGFSIVEPAAF